jgi:autoinducer 2-degrading protein
MSAIVLLVDLKLHPGQREAYVARARRHRETVLAREPGCKGFEIILPDDDADCVVLFETYEDDAALAHHDGTEYMAEYRSDTGPMIAERNRRMCRLGSA